jgi:hypothetical protein
LEWECVQEKPAKREPPAPRGGAAYLTAVRVRQAELRYELWFEGSETSNAVLFFGFGGEVAVSVIAVSSAGGSDAHLRFPRIV